jgi:hypothetical protein
MKTFTRAILVISIFVACISNSGNYVRAQTYLDSPFNIEIFFSDQDPETKVFRIKAQITSQIVSDRNTIKWILPEGLQTTSGETEIIGYYCQIAEGINTGCVRKEGSNKPQTLPGIDIPINKPDTFEFEIDVVPYKPVKGNVVFTIQAYIADGERSYKVTQIANLETNTQKELLPQTLQYKNLEQIIQLRQLSTQGMIIGFIVFIALIIFRRVYNYVYPPVKSSLPHNSKILEAFHKLPPTP